MFVCVYMFIYMHGHSHTCAFTYMCICIHVIHIHVHSHTCAFAYMCIHIHVHLHTCHSHTCAFTCTFYLLLCVIYILTFWYIHAPQVDNKLPASHTPILAYPTPSPSGEPTPSYPVLKLYVERVLYKSPFALVFKV